jgi:hypothetical protein
MAKSKAALILAFGKGKMPMGKMGKKPMKDSEEDMMPEDKPSEGKKAMAQEVLDAIKANDAEGLAQALDDFWA